MLRLFTNDCNIINKTKVLYYNGFKVGKYFLNLKE